MAVDERLDAEPSGERRVQRHADVGDRPLIVEADIESVRPGVHHVGPVVVIGRLLPGRIHLLDQPIEGVVGTALGDLGERLGA